MMCCSIIIVVLNVRLHPEDLSGFFIPSYWGGTSNEDIVALRHSMWWKVKGMIYPAEASMNAVAVVPAFVSFIINSFVSCFLDESISITVLEKSDLFKWKLKSVQFVIKRKVETIHSLHEKSLTINTLSKWLTDGLFQFIYIYIYIKVCQPAFSITLWLHCRLTKH